MADVKGEEVVKLICVIGNMIRPLLPLFVSLKLIRRAVGIIPIFIVDY
jgi:hypothetical protein